MGKQVLCAIALLMVPGLASAGGMTILDPLPASLSGSAAQVSDDGSVVVGISVGSGISEASRWTGGVTTGLGFLPGDTQSGANGVSADGAVVVGYSSNGLANEAFRWTGGVMTGLGFLSGDIDSSANGVSADGAVVVGRSCTDVPCSGFSGMQAFRWTGGVMTALGALPGGTYSFAYGVSDDGTTVVGYSNNGGGEEAFQWFGGVMTGLGFLPGDTGSFAYGASNTGLVVGESINGSGREAFVWTPWDGMERLEVVLATNGATGLAGWKLESASAISADGQWVVGTGTNPAGAEEAFLANLASPNSFRPLGSLPSGAPSSAHGVSADGAVVVGVLGYDSEFYGEAFRWTEAGPSGFTFNDQTNVALSATITSDPVVITGISAATDGLAAISVTGGSYSVGCDGVFTSVAGTISNNQTVCVRQTSAATEGTATNTTLTIGGVVDTFTSTTVAASGGGGGGGSGGGALDGFSLLILSLMGVMRRKGPLWTPWGGANSIRSD